MSCLRTAVSLLLLLSASTAAAPATVADLNTVLEKRGTPWVARDNPIARLSADERDALGGVLDAPPPRTAQTLAAPAGLPSTIDWRDHNGNFVTSIKNQGGCGSCWAFAAVAVAESSILIEADTPGVDLDLSEQFVLSCSGGGGCIGGVPQVATSILAEYGARTETCFPYSSYDETCLHSCTDEDEVVRLRSVREVAYDDTTMKIALQLSPLTACFTIFDDFYSYGGGVYEPVSAVVTGAHAVEVIGYDDAQQAWIAKNQWGSEWGEAGFFRIRYGAAGFGWCGSGFEKNSAPVMTVPSSVAVAGGEALALQIVTSDRDVGDRVVVTVDGLAGATVDANNVLHFTPGAERGIFTARLTATDDWLRPASSTTSITISVCDTACDDNNPCTTDTCPLGVCTHDNDDTATCADDDNDCTIDSCRAGVCHVAVNNGNSCVEDGDPCTKDTCVDAVCVHDTAGNVGLACIAGGDGCGTATCNQAGECVGAAINEGGLCDDGRACTDTDHCELGRCVSSFPAICDDGVGCTQDYCDDKPLAFDEPRHPAPFIDISGRADVVDLRLDGDDVSSGPVALGFDWTPDASVALQSTMFVSVNGVVRFDRAEDRFVSTCLPDGVDAVLIAALWNDWRCDRDDGCRIFTALLEANTDDDNTGRTRVVQWTAVRSLLHKDTRVTFELLIHEDAGWQLRVDRVLGARDHFATIGAAFGADRGITQYCGDVAVTAGLQVIARSANAPSFGCFAAAEGDQCVVDDQCVPSGTVHPDNSCLVCNSVGYEPARGGSCDDGQRCTSNDRCDDGECRGTPPRACADDLACTIDSCTDVVGGATCSHEPAAGSCVIDGACVEDGVVHPTNPCLVCDAAQSATAWSARPFVACDDGNACTADDVCDAGVCVGSDVCGEDALLPLGEVCVDNADCASTLCFPTANHGDVCCSAANGCCVDDSDCDAGAGTAVCAVDHQCRIVAAPVEPVGEGEGELGLGGGGCAAAPSSSSSAALLLLGVLLLLRRRRV